MTKVLFLPEVVDQFLQLSEILYAKGYLAFKDIAIEYAENLFIDIKVNLPNKLRKDAPEYFELYGKDLYYSLFPHNKHTTWYVFYSIHSVDDDIVFLIRYLSNNHMIAHHLTD